MEIEERSLENVVILDLKGKLTLGDGDELLKEKINNLMQQGHRNLLLNLESVPYVDSAGLGGIVHHLYDRQSSGWHAQARQPHKTHHRSADDHQAVDGLRDVRLRSRSGKQL